MSFFPVNQKRLTNMAIVKYHKGGKRFEIACYKNKVVDWRNKNEKDIDEVLQTHTVYKNVSKAERADRKDMEDVFGTTDEDQVCLIILEKGELQVSEKERKEDYESKNKELVTLITNKCVNRETKRPFPPRIIETSLKEINFTVKPNKSTKSQAMQAIQELQKILPIERAQMRLRFEVPSKAGKELKQALQPHIAAVEEEEYGINAELVILIDPGEFRAVDEQFQKITKGKGTLEILDMQVRAADDETL